MLIIPKLALESMHLPLSSAYKWKAQAIADSCSKGIKDRLLKSVEKSYIIKVSEKRKCS